MAWDPDRYLRYADLRARPGLELISRIPQTDAAKIVDLGAGAGNLTAILAERWPNADITGIDSSTEMIDRASADHPGIRWELAAIDTWEPGEPVDVIYSNAALHWLDDHESLFRRLRSYLAPRGVIAVQMPDNWREPTHTIPKNILAQPGWSADARRALLSDRVNSPGEYRDWLQPAEVDQWRTTYYQTLTGQDPIWTWVTGSVLRPVLQILDDTAKEEFERACKNAYEEAYPPEPDGSTTLPFSRRFLVARAP